MSLKSENLAPSPSAPPENATESAQILRWTAALASPVLVPGSLRPGPIPAPGPQNQPHLYRIDAAAPAEQDPASYLVIAAGTHLPVLLQASRVLADAGLRVPAIVASDAESGLALALDYGSLTYLHHLSLDSAHQLYMEAIGALLALQTASRPEQLPELTRAALHDELALFAEYFLGTHLKLEPTATQAAQLQKVFDAVLANIGAQQQVYIHRNFEARNLLVLPGAPAVLGVGHAAYGPITYDLVSLLRDATIAWDEEMVLDWVVRYWQSAKQAGLPVDPDIDAFYRDFEMMGVQRHLMQLGLFARLAHEGDASHLGDMAQLLDYIRKAGNRYTVLKPLVRLLDDWEQKQPQVGYTF